MTAYDFGDVILIGFPHTDFRNVSKRPALVIYDADDHDILVARITTQEHITGVDYKIVDWRQSGLITESFVRLSKQATIEKKYIIKKLGTLIESEQENVKSVLREIFNLLVSRITL
jgi:mRNA interferase MazF